MDEVSVSRVLRLAKGMGFFAAAGFVFWRGFLFTQSADCSIAPVLLCVGTVVAMLLSGLALVARKGPTWEDVAPDPAATASAVAQPGAPANRPVRRPYSTPGRVRVPSPAERSRLRMRSGPTR